jgi:hypothetical protein
MSSKQYAAGISLLNNDVLFIPKLATGNIEIFTPTTGNMITIYISSLTSQSYKYNGGVLLSDGRVVFVPYNANNIGIYNSNTATFNVIDISASITGDSKYARGVLLSDGRVLFVPYNANNIGIFNSVNNSFSVITSPQLALGGNKYIGGILLLNGNVAFVPSDANNIGLFNTVTNIFSIIDISSTINTVSKYSGGILLPNGKVVFVPDNANNIGIFDLSNISNPLLLFDISSIISINNKYSDGLLVIDKIVFIPKNANNVGIYEFGNTLTSFPFYIDTLLIDNTLINKFSGGLLLSTSEILLIPDNSSTFYRYNVSSMESVPVFATGSLVLPPFRSDVHVEYLFNNNLNDSGINAIPLSLSSTNASIQYDTLKGSVLSLTSPLSGIATSSAAINTSVTELISSTFLTNGTGLTISFDINFTKYASTVGSAYYIVGIGQNISTITSWQSDVDTDLDAYGISLAITNTEILIAYSNNSGKFKTTYNNINGGPYTSFPLNTWVHIDIVILANSITPLIYINGVLATIGSVYQQDYTTSVYFAENSGTLTHFAASGDTAYKIANFKMWKKSLNATELTNNYNYMIDSYKLKYKSSLLLQDKRVLLIPNTYTKICIYNPALDTLFYGPDATGYGSAVLLPDSRVILIPNTATNIGIYNPITNILELGPVATGYAGGVFMQTGKVFLTANTATNSGIYDPVTNTFSEIIYPA